MTLEEFKNKNPILYREMERKLREAILAEETSEDLEAAILEEEESRAEENESEWIIMRLARNRERLDAPKKLVERILFKEA